MRWQRLALMLASGSLPDSILLEDAEDLSQMAEYSGRIIPRHMWVDSIRRDILADSHESDF